MVEPQTHGTENFSCVDGQGRQAFICLHGIHKRFGEKVILDDFSLNVFPGETLVILGGSGTGKSVSLRHITGLIRPDRGEVLVDGQRVHTLRESQLVEVRRKVGYLFQGGALFDSMNVYDNIAFPLREARWSEQEVAARIPEVLALVDLDEDVAGQMPDALSGGMQKRVALARAIAVEPRAILYDEPTTGLDPVTANTINDLIRSMQQRLGVTSVVVTHDIQSAFRVGDRIAFLYQGRIRFLGTVRQARETDDPVLAAFIAGRSLEEGRSDA